MSSSFTIIHPAKPNRAHSTEVPALHFEIVTFQRYPKFRTRDKTVPPTPSLSMATTQTHPDPPPGSKPAFIPLEANPELMTTLLHKLGLSNALQIHDVYSISDPELLAFIPRPALALLLVFPVSAVYESQRMAEDAPLPEYSGKGEDEPVIWFKQTIRNACGLMGLLHAVSNGPARGFIGKYWLSPPFPPEHSDCPCYLSGSMLTRSSHI